MDSRREIREPPRLAEVAKGEMRMAEKLDEKELVTFKEMLMANSIQVDALCRLLLDKEIITEDEFYTKLKEVQAEYEARPKKKLG